MPPTPMSPLDAWLHSHQAGGSLCMTFGLVARFVGEPPALDALRDRAAHRWAHHDRLRMSSGTGLRWIPGPPFDPVHHVGTPARRASPDEHTAHLIARPFGPPRPPWQLHLLPGPDGGFALLLRAHHALLDGRSALVLVQELLDGPAALPGQRAGSQAPPRRRPGLTDLLPAGRPLPLHGPVDSRRAVAWSTVTAGELAAARDALPSGRASANAVFLAATAGALRGAGATGRLPFLPGVCAMVPVDVRPDDDGALLGNHYATVRVPLPSHGRARRRLAAVDRFTRRVALHERARAQARAVAGMAGRRGALTEALGRYVDSSLYSSLLCSSLADRGGPRTLGPAALTGLALLPSLSPGHPLAVTMVRDATGAATLTVVTDHARRVLAGRLSALLREEIRALGP
ncbi:wax ester/triacylglycerol synthase domain-containing protein [Streptomyces luteireticuli]|uniref:wax ester/triacylglycerol synthase domain-containing protein n=1 Tax=Streptomyces luteireticuli TaxID=173858 RepID=UPI003555CF98